jgi:cation efflux system membrane fusion protein
MSPVFHPDCAILRPSVLGWVLIHRPLRLAASSSVSAAALLAALAAAPSAQAHAGHGDAFQPQGDARQVKRLAESDGLLGVATVKPKQGFGGLSVPSTAIVDADGQSLLFVQTSKTYDPVFVQTGPSQGDQVVVKAGIDPTDDVVVAGALSLYAESMKTEQDGAQAGASKPAAPNVASPAAQNVPPLPVLAAAAVALLSGAGIWLGRRRRANG